MPVFEVSCHGDVRDERAWSAVHLRFDVLAGPAGEARGRHHFIVLADDERVALDMITEPLAAAGDFTAFRVHEIRAAGTPEVVDVETASAELRSLSEIERGLLRALVEGAKPTGILAADPQLPSDPERLTASLRRLVSRGLLTTVETGDGADTPGLPGVRLADPWWQISPAGWSLILCHERPGDGQLIDRTRPASGVD